MGFINGLMPLLRKRARLVAHHQAEMSTCCCIVVILQFEKKKENKAFYASRHSERLSASSTIRSVTNEMVNLTVSCA